MVLDQQHGDAVLAQLADADVELIDFLRVHARRRLVEQQQGGLGRERAGEFEPALLAERQIGRQFIALVREIEELERAVDLLARAARAAQPAPEKILVALLAGILRDPEILPDRQLPEQTNVLERSRDPQRHPRMRRPIGDVGAVEDDAAGGRRKQAADEIDDRALARAVRADEAENFAARDRQIDAIDRADAAEMLGEPREIKHRFDPCSGRSAA